MSLINIFMTLLGYIILCALIWFKWCDYKQQNNYKGLYMGDILIGIIALPLTIILGITQVISKLIKIKIK
ncbi:hypothetical protein [Clostridium botulinum]|uniref:hypothetical protein n=1 Tax=Clostridium botulinum TaxID=1491 RepID=UPI000773ABA5|nr:hypothetical protein [Clostridium botulinum]APH20858.1 putative membrane protein [Clostridium botulinum]APQ71331.1 putative membrane protein [Clostridium botulinum]MBN3379266.1 hypothetical protein [Clostridium botulinum]